MATVTVEEITLEEFREGIYHIACEDQLEADRLFERFKERVLEEVVKTSNAKKAGKTPAQIIFERMKRNEESRHREILRKNMESAEQSLGINSPSNTACHHIVPCTHSRARDARRILKMFGIDINSADNGVRLPLNKDYVPHEDMPNAYPHSIVHTKKYIINVTTLLMDEARRPGVTKDDIADVLDEIADSLVNGTFPLKKEIDNDYI